MMKTQCPLCKSLSEAKHECLNEDVSNLIILLISPQPSWYHLLRFVLLEQLLLIYMKSNQLSTKDVGFYIPVISIIDELEFLLPVVTKHPAAVVLLTKLVVLVGYAALPANVREIIPAQFDLGITIALNHVAIQLFVAVLKPLFLMKC